MWSRQDLVGEPYKLADTDQLVTRQNADPRAAGDGYKVVGARRTHCDRAKRVDLVQTAVVLKLGDLGRSLKAAANTSRTYILAIRFAVPCVLWSRLVSMARASSTACMCRSTSACITSMSPGRRCSAMLANWRKRHAGFEEAFTNCLR